MAGMVDNGVRQSCDAICKSVLSFRVWPFSTLRFFRQAGAGQLGYRGSFRVEAWPQLVMICPFVVLDRAVMAAYPRVDPGWSCLLSELNPDQSWDRFLRSGGQRR